jgi:hypothetical protein
MIRMLVRWNLLVMTSFILSCPVWAISTTVNQTQGPPATISTATVGGHCLVEPLGGSDGVDVSCSDGSSYVRANTLTGCLDYEGRGICAMGSLGIGLWGGTQLVCDKGTPQEKTYNVSTGTEVPHKGCKLAAGVSATCDDGAGNTSGATCAGGCGDYEGKGCCCRTDTPNCGPGNACNGK